MKEEAETSSKLPPKIIMGGVGGSSSSTTMAALMLKSTSASTIPNLNTMSNSNQLNPPTPSKQQSDEILSTLLRMNNFDSISSIKDESLDIDLSACVTISADPSGTIGGNSLSSSDFWRVLDESAQTSQLDVSNGSVGNGVVGGVGGGSCNTSRESLQASPSASSNGNSLPANDKNEFKVVVKKEQTDFSGTFLKPSTGISFSPLKRSIKPLQAEQHIRKEKSPTRLVKTETGPPSLAPIMRIHQTFIKPQVELQKLNNGANTQTVQLHNNNCKQQKEIMLANNQPPPLTALGQPMNKESAVVKPFVLPEPLYKCLDCENLIFRSPDLNKHTNHRLIYKCPDCEREFDVETSLKKHLKTHRPIDARKDAWKKCPDCGKCLKLGSMWMHRKIHTENKKYGCEICGQKFVQKINLTHHQRIHTSEKPYECSECQKRFQERSHLQRHQKYHAQTRSYRCEKCGKMYKTERCLKVHNLVHLEQRPFACTVCDKSFISNSKLKQHSNIHTGERPFKCNYCPRDFTNFPNWLKHTRRRHKVDHKTGEMLENIPSYCSKKSTRTPKEKKTNEVKTTAVASAKNNNSNNSAAPTTTNQKPIDLKKMETNELQQQQQQKILTTFSTAITTTTTSAHYTAPTTVFTTITMAKPLLTVTSVSNNQPSSLNGPPPLAKVPAKRKKKQTAAVLSQVSKADFDSSLVTTASTTTSTTNYLISSASLHANLPVVTTNCGSGPPPLALVYNNKPINVISTTLSNTNTTNTTLKTTQHQHQSSKQQQQPTKVEKVKRERKQPMPKQVQQVPPPLIIKKEFVEPSTEVSIASHEQQQQLQLRLQQSQQQQQQTKVSFTDLHCLSITSAEELIMEQALEMEECGLYKASLPTNVHDHHVMSNFADTDNAISSDSMADLHFKIKEEHHDMELKLKTEEFDSIKKQSICSSMESSPFSSPASMEFAPSSTLTTTNDFTTNNFYLPPFTIGNNQIITTNAPITAMRIEDCRGTVATAHTYLPQLITTNVSVPDLIQINNNNQRYLKATSSTTNGGSNSVGGNMNSSSFINQLYLPLTVNAGPVLMKSNQALPSVDTLLFSNTKLGLFNNRNLPKQATTAQHNLS
ncbi:serendipity locus protein H-1 [Lucilia cuprina]|uniref:serendipity locus protein H-1 n=1 Tax=Lucilia cuprina TaxID=7375 RepID=UPI001F0563CC|nr:serendipity locus protein H-1 [Lucilia cuprina]